MNAPAVPQEDTVAAQAAAHVMQLTDITQSLSTSLMASIQTIDRLNQRIKALEDQQKTQQLCLAKSLLALGTIAQNMEDEATQASVFKILEEALGEIRRANAPAPATVN